jgi:hypothetical protein
MAGLPNSRRQIARAKEHCADVERKFKAFWDGHKQTPFFEPDPQRSEYEILKIRIEDPIPIDSFADSAHDAVTNLRSSLDSAGYALAEGSGRSRLRSTGFSFANSAAELENQIKGRSKDIPEEIYPIFRAYQPYRGGNDTLWALNEACNAHKHQGLVRLDTGTRLGNIMLTGGLVNLFSPPLWDSLKQEIECGTFFKGSKVEGNIEVGMFIAFDEIEVIGGEPVSRVLGYFVEIVEDIISTLEAEGTRLGFLK